MFLPDDVFHLNDSDYEHKESGAKNMSEALNGVNDNSIASNLNAEKNNEETTNVELNEQQVANNDANSNLNTPKVINTQEQSNVQFVGQVVNNMEPISINSEVADNSGIETL